MFYMILSYTVWYTYALCFAVIRESWKSITTLPAYFIIHYHYWFCTKHVCLLWIWNFEIDYNIPTFLVPTKIYSDMIPPPLLMLSVILKFSIDHNIIYLLKYFPTWYHHHYWCCTVAVIGVSWKLTTAFLFFYSRF